MLFNKLVTVSIITLAYICFSKLMWYINDLLIYFLARQMISLLKKLHVTCMNKK